MSSRPDHEARLAIARSLLVPGHRPDRFDKAVASGADLVIVDLEDALNSPPSPRGSHRRWRR